YATGNVGQALQGKMAGIEVTSSSGKPGGNVDIKIRGTATLGDNTPLYIIDGMPDDINNVSPNDIESLEVLKDGAAAAIYGSRAANGVVIITTKQGKVGTPKLHVKAYYGVETLAKKLPLTNAEQHVSIMNQAYENAGLEPFYEGTPDSYGDGTDWVEELFSPAAVQNYNVSYSGGGENFIGSASIDYFNQDGIVMNTGFERISSRFNTEFKKGKLTLNQTLGAHHSVNKRENSRAVWRSLEMPPTVPVFDENNLGGFAGVYGPMFDIMNPVAAQSLFTNRRSVDHIQANFAATYELIPNLRLKLNSGATIDNIYDFRHTPVYQMPILSNTIPRMNENRHKKTNWLVEGTVNYDFSLQKNNFTVLLGVSSQSTEYRNLYGAGANMPNDDIQVMDAATEEIFASGGAWKYNLASQFGRLNYNYDNRYLVSLTLRRDGSSRFGANNQYGLFPSASVAWRLSEESFFPENTLFQDIKIRASYGELGNQEIANYAFSASINSSTHYVLGADQSLIFGATQVDFVTPNIKWESNISRNIGVDLVLSENWIVNMDYFSNKSVDLLVQVPIPASNGSNRSPYQNIGEILNTGFEMNAAWNKKFNDFKIGVSGAVSAIKNEVKTLGNDQLSIWAGKPYHLADNTTLTKKGNEIASFYLIKTDGIFNSEEEVESYTFTNNAGETMLIQPNAVPGDIRFVDANGDGKINADDRVYCGSAMPKMTYGLNLSMEYRNFDLTCFLQGVYGNKIFNGSAYSLEGLPNFTNMSSKLLNAWRPDNHSNIPRVTRQDTNGNGRTQSDRFLQDGTYLRMKNLQVGYRLPERLKKIIFTEQARIYISAQNLFTLTSYEGFDPDVANDGLLNRGVDNGVYPSARTYLVGVQLTF
ncbi:MAG: SusC/RagA family TonB-linked outer membrane protein, partial [Draconibacterium sp.]